MKRLLFLIAIALGTNSFAARVDTVSTYSAAMKKAIPAIVVTPDAYDAARSYPVIYLLHGYSGDCYNWMKIAGDIIRETADRNQVIVVSPDGGYSSWYFDVPNDPDYQYETYVGRELIAQIDSLYSTRAHSSGRAITGLSMGGHGALYLAFRHPDVFGIAGSTSGGVDFRPFPLNWDLPKRLGSYAEHPENWENQTVINNLHRITPNRPKIIVDCGTEDFFYTVNLRLHEKLLENNLPHDYISRPGKHDAAYWKTAIQHQLLFMTEAFKEKP